MWCAVIKHNGGRSVTRGLLLEVSGRAYPAANPPGLARCAFALDLVFLLLAPEGAGADHLKALARIARLLRDPTITHKLRGSHDAEALYAVLAMPSASAA